MSTYLNALDAARIDFFSLDVEGAELEVLLTIDFTVVTVDVFLIEIDDFHDSAQNWKARTVPNLGTCSQRLSFSSTLLHDGHACVNGLYRCAP